MWGGKRGVGRGRGMDRGIKHQSVFWCWPSHRGFPSVCESVHLEVLKFWSLPELLSDIFLCVLDLWHWQSASSLSTAPQSKLRYQQPCSNGEFWPKQGCPASWGFPPPTISSAVSLLSWQWFYLATVWDNARHTTDKGFFVGLLLSVTQVASHCADSVGQKGWGCENDWGRICVWGGKFEPDLFVMLWSSLPKSTEMFTFSL